MPRQPLFALALAILLAACGKEKEAPPEQPEPGTMAKSGGSIRLRGDFIAPDGATLSITQLLALEKGSVLSRSGDGEVTGTMAITLSEQQTIRFLDDGRREIAVGEGGSELRTQLGEGQPVEESTPEPLAGKTVIAIPGPDGSWSYAFAGDDEGEVPTGFSGLDLRGDSLYPGGYLSFGDSWKPDPSAAGHLLGAGFQLRSGEVEMRLLAIDSRRGQSCAEIGVDIKADGVFQSQGSRQEVSVRLKGKIFRSLHLYQDIEANLSGTISLHSEVGTQRVDIEGPASFRRAADWKS